MLKGKIRKIYVKVAQFTEIVTYLYTHGLFNRSIFTIIVRHKKVLKRLNLIHLQNISSTFKLCRPCHNCNFNWLLSLNKVEVLLFNIWTKSSTNLTPRVLPRRHISLIITKTKQWYFCSIFGPKVLKYNNVIIDFLRFCRCKKWYHIP